MYNNEYVQMIDLIGVWLLISDYWLDMLVLFLN